MQVPHNNDIFVRKVSFTPCTACASPRSTLQSFPLHMLYIKLTCTHTVTMHNAKLNRKTTYKQSSCACVSLSSAQNRPRRSMCYMYI